MSQEANSNAASVAIPTTANGNDVTSNSNVIAPVRPPSPARGMGLKFPLRRVPVKPISEAIDSDDDEELEKREEGETRATQASQRAASPKPPKTPKSPSPTNGQLKTAAELAADSKVTPDALERPHGGDSPIIKPAQPMQYPYAGRGRRLADVIKECWRTWTEMMIMDARNGFTEAMVEYGLALWRGDRNAGILQNRKEGRRWMAKAVRTGKHELYAQGSCGRANCHKCAAIYYLSKMDLWIHGEEIKVRSASKFQVLHTPSIMLRIAKYLDANDLIALHQCNRMWRNFVEDPRAWTHLDAPLNLPQQELPVYLREQTMTELRWRFPAAVPKQLPPLDPLPPTEVAMPLTCRGCMRRLKPDEPRYDAIEFPNIFAYVIVVCEDCFNKKAYLDFELRPTSARDALILSRQWDLKFEARASYNWERAAVRRKRIRGAAPPELVIQQRLSNSNPTKPISPAPQSPNAAETSEGTAPPHPRHRPAPHLQDIHVNPEDIDRQLAGGDSSPCAPAQGQKSNFPAVESPELAETEGGEGSTEEEKEEEAFVPPPLPEPIESKGQKKPDASASAAVASALGCDDEDMDAMVMDFFMGGKLDLISEAVKDEQTKPAAAASERKADTKKASTKLKKPKSSPVVRKPKRLQGRIVPNLITPLGWPKAAAGSDPYFHLDFGKYFTPEERAPLQLGEPIDELPFTPEGEPEIDPFAQDTRAKIMMWKLDEFAFVPRNIANADDESTESSPDNPLSSMSGVPALVLIAYDKLVRARGLAYLKLRYRMSRFWLALSNLPEAEGEFAAKQMKANAAANSSKTKK